MLKGFVLEMTPYGSRLPSRKISVQLTPTGVRYYLVSTESMWGLHPGKETIRDISTQYRSLRAMFDLKEGQVDFARDRLVEHTKKFYPESCIPDGVSDPFVWAAFPMLGAAMKQKSTLWPPMAVNLQVATGLRAFSVKDMVFQLFGESPRQLQAAASQSIISNSETINIDNLTLASMLRGYLPPNEMAEILKLNLGLQGQVQQIEKRSVNAIRLLLRRFRPQRLMRLMQSFQEDTRSDLLLRDAGVQYAMARQSHPEVVMDLSRQFKSIKELHDVITREFRKLQNPDVEISYSDDLTMLLGRIPLGGSKLVLPKTTHELITWGDAMNNCIYSYGKSAAEGRCVLLAIVDATGEMTHNLMIQNQRVIQCYGKANARCTDEVLIKALFDGLIDADIIGPDNDHTLWCGPRNVAHW